MKISVTQQITDVAITSVMVDIAQPEKGVDVAWSTDRKVLWVNVDGVCVLRIGQIPKLWVVSQEEPEQEGIRAFFCIECRKYVPVASWTEDEESHKLECPSCGAKRESLK